MTESDARRTTDASKHTRQTTQDEKNKKYTCSTPSPYYPILLLCTTARAGTRAAATLTAWPAAPPRHPERRR